MEDKAMESDENFSNRNVLDSTYHDGVQKLHVSLVLK